MVQSVKGVLSDYKYLILAIFVLFLSLVSPTPKGLSYSGQVVLGIFAFTIILWISEAIPIAVTSLLIFVLLSVLNVVEAKDAFLGFGNSVVFFLIGAFLLAAAIERHNLHLRVALTILSRFGKNSYQLLLGVIITGGALSMLMPEHAVVALFLPVLLGILHSFDLELSDSSFAKSILLALTFSASIGSMGSLLGGARNPLAITLYTATTGSEVSFLDWMIAAVPIVALMLLLLYIVLRLVFPHEQIDVEVAKTHMMKQVSRLGKMGFNEKKTLAIYIFAIVLWITLGTKMGLAVVAIVASALLFVTRTITWKDAEEYMPWGIVFLYGGAVSLGFSLVETGAAEFITNNLMVLVGGNPLFILLFFTVLCIGLSNIMSNSATVAVILPIAMTVMVTLGFPPVIAMYTVAMASALVFLLIIGTPGNAIVYSSEVLSPRDFIKAGKWLSIVAILIFPTIAFLWWRFLGLIP